MNSPRRQKPKNVRNLTTKHQNMWGPSLVDVIISHFILFSRYSLANMHELKKRKRKKKKERKKSKSKPHCFSLLLACLFPWWTVEEGRNGHGDRSQEVSRPFEDILIAILFTCKFTLSNRKKKKSRNSTRTDGLAEGAHRSRNLRISYFKNHIPIQASLSI